MSRASMPAITCDSEHGCDQWSADYYAQTAYLVNGVRINQTRRSPGWISTWDYDYCPQHVEEATS